ncbi:MAG: segregation and condensation protein A [Burkholderiales bacterium]
MTDHPDFESSPDAYHVHLSAFEGPLDLLIHLIRRNEVNIYDIPISLITEQYLEFIRLMEELDLDVAGEFLVMASTLMYIKSRELLPIDQQVTAEGEDDGEDPRWHLIRQLVEYKKFKDAAAQLHALEMRQEGTFPRLPAKPEFVS